ncbi:MAG: hypothetical protein KJ063_04435 [Anaerolineae bacterium]|nr:hypothetical protein [Anaerolineae bacterium]
METMKKVWDAAADASSASTTTCTPYQADAMSDIDLLVLLNQPFDYFSELWQLIEVLDPIQLQSDHLISAKPVLFNEFEDGAIQLYRNAKREGILVA